MYNGQRVPVQSGPNGWGIGMPGGQFGYNQAAFMPYDPNTGQVNEAGRYEGAADDMPWWGPVVPALAAGAFGAVAAGGAAAAGAGGASSASWGPDGYGAIEGAGAGTGAAAGGAGAGVEDDILTNILNGDPSTTGTFQNPSGVTSIIGDATEGLSPLEYAKRYGQEAANKVFGNNSNGSGLLGSGGGALATGLLAAALSPTTINSTAQQNGTAQTNSQTTGQTNSTNSTTGQTNTSGTQGLAPWLQPYAQDLVQMSADNAHNAAGAQMNAINGTSTVANSTNPLNAAGTNLALQTMGGQYLNPQSNPYLQQTYDLAANRMADAYSRGTGAQTMAGFAQNGAFGGSAMQETQGANNRAFGDSLANLGNQIFGGNYQQERDRQSTYGLNAPGMAQTQQNTSLNGFNQLYNQGQGLLQQYNQAINPAYGSQTTGQANTNQYSTGQANTNQYTNQLATTNQNSQSQQAGVPRLNAFTGGALLGSQLFG
jgi:hypothetical protein